MADTGAPWFIPYVEPTDIPRTYPQDSEDLADAIAAGLSAAGGLVAVKHVLKTNTFVSASVGVGGSVAIDGLSIDHEVSTVGNKVLLFGFIGTADSANQGAKAGICFAQDGTLLNIADAASSRNRVGAGGWNNTPVSGPESGALSISHIVTPTAGSKQYTIRIMNVQNSAQVMYVNRTPADVNNAQYSRTTSSMLLMEVKV